MPRLTPRQVMVALMVGAMLASSVVPASAATTLASFAGPTPVSAFRDTVVVSEFDTGIRAYRLGVLKPGGPVHTLPVASRRLRTFDVSVGRGPDGRALVAFGDCPAAGPCGVYGVDPQTDRIRLLAASRDRATEPSAISLAQLRFTWVEGSSVYAARVGRRARLVARVPRQRIVATALAGRTLALGVLRRPNNAQIVVQTLGDSRRKVIDDVTIGEAGRTFVGLSFHRNTLYWARVCEGDPSGCDHGIARRYNDGHFSHARVPENLAGFAVASSGVYWVTQNSFGECFTVDDEHATCDLQQSTLRFGPGRGS